MIARSLAWTRCVSVSFCSYIFHHNLLFNVCTSTARFLRRRAVLITHKHLAHTTRGKNLSFI